MTKQQIDALEVRQLELLAIMASSDGRAAKCVKNGTSFREVYPDDFAAYNSANAEYNANEAEIARLTTILETEVTDEMPAGEISIE